MITIELKGREIPLLYTTWEMKQIQDEIGPISDAIAKVLGRNPKDKKDMSRYMSAEHLEAVAQMIKIMGNAGLEEAGEKPDLTEKKVLRAIKPSELADVVDKCMDAMSDGMHSEIPPKKAGGPVDVTLEEINKKKEKED